MSKCPTTRPRPRERWWVSKDRPTLRARTFLAGVIWLQTIEKVVSCKNPTRIEVRRYATNIRQSYPRRRKANAVGSRGQGHKLGHPLLHRRGRCRWSPG